MPFDSRDKRNVLVLAACQLTFTSGRSLFIATAPLVAYVIAANKALATLPTSLVIEWHILGMFASGFGTGSLIKRFGTLPIILAGLGLLVASVFIALAGREVWNFWAAMLILRVRWNSAFTGGSVLLTEVYTPAERAKTQGANNFPIFGAVAVASLSSGALLHFFGWKWVGLSALPLIAIAMASTLWLALMRRRSPAATLWP